MAASPAVVPTLNIPPGKCSPYILPSYTGELWTIPTSNSTMRLLVTGKETSNAFAVVSTGGTFDKPIGFHYHKETHDVFLCLKGTLNVWADDTARSLGPGDFASVPPGTIHQYQIASSHSEFIGLIIPGGWEEFFRFIGEPFSGPLFPTNDKRNPFEVLIPKLIAATEQFDMIPVREKESFDPQPWNGTENSLPGRCERGGYFLKADMGPKYLFSGTVISPLATQAETEGRFSVYGIEGALKLVGNWQQREFCFTDTHHALQTVTGIVALFIEGRRVDVAAGETVFVPAGTRWRLEVVSAYAKAYLFANGGGMGEILQRLGQEYKFAGVPETAVAEAWEEQNVKKLETELGFK